MRNNFTNIGINIYYDNTTLAPSFHVANELKKTAS